MSSAFALAGVSSYIIVVDKQTIASFSLVMHCSVLIRNLLKTKLLWDFSNYFSMLQNLVHDSTLGFLG